MSRERIRRRSQLRLLRKDVDVGCGTLCGISLSADDLLRTSADSPWTIEYIPFGLTTHVYKIRDGDRIYSLKVRRNPILVANVDGQTSFLNEVQRRVEIESRRVAAPADWAFAVETVYADYRKGLILSPWIEGRPIAFDAAEIGALFDALVVLASNGFFEWDLSHGNYLWTNSGIRFFDYGYMYRFNPMTEMNSNGLATPIFNIAERFETRCLFGHLLRLLECDGLDAALSLYALEKSLAMRALERLRGSLATRNARATILAYFDGVIERHRVALSSSRELYNLFRLESFRSWRLDVDDDISGKSCTLATLSKARKLVGMIADDFDFFKRHDGLFFGEEGMTQSNLVAKYENRLAAAQRYMMVVRPMSTPTDRTLE